MKLALLIPALFLCYSLNAQFVVQDSFVVETTVDDTIVVGPFFTGTNVDTSALDFYWILERDDDVPRDWQFSICDLISCWEVGKEAAECVVDLNTLGAESSYDFFKVGLKHFGTKGRHSVSIYYVSECDNLDEGNILSKAVFTFDVSGGVATKDVSETLTQHLYPNPSSGFVNIANDEQVTELSFYNSSGQKIKTVPHVSGERHDITELDLGVYMVELRDNNRQTLKVVRISKTQ